MRVLPVHLTIDVEAAEARRRGSRVVPPLSYDARVWGRFSNQKCEFGLRRLARDLERRRLVATFYVEALGARYFGLDGLRAIVECLLAHGQDVQLHLHPTQRDPEALMHGRQQADDNMSAYSCDMQVELIQDGLELLERAGVPRSHLVAFRAGNFGASAVTWEACLRAGLRLSSNYNPGYFDVACSMRHAEARPDLFVPVSGLWELPISCVRTARGKLRHVQLTALSSLEVRAALEAMRDAHYLAATLVSHSFELYTVRTTDGLTGSPSLVNFQRWNALLDLLERSTDRFQTESALGLVARLGAMQAPCEASPEVPRTPLVFESLRHLEQLAKRFEPHVRLPLPRAWTPD